MARLFDDATIIRFSQEAEDVIAEELKCFVARIPLQVIAGVSEYTLPDNVIEIRRVTYRGNKVYPINYRTYRNYGNTVDARGTPRVYIFNNLGQNTIKLYPTPTETIVGGATSSQLFLTTELFRVVCVEYYSSPNFADEIIPVYFRRRLIKAYTLKMCYLMEGPGQNLKASKYWEEKWEFLKSLYSSLLFDMISGPRRLIASSNSVADNRLLARPVLPAGRFGIGVNPGE